MVSAVDQSTATVGITTEGLCSGRSLFPLWWTGGRKGNASAHRFSPFALSLGPPAHMVTHIQAVPSPFIKPSETPRSAFHSARWLHTIQDAGGD